MDRGGGISRRPFFHKYRFRKTAGNCRLTFADNASGESESLEPSVPKHCRYCWLSLLTFLGVTMRHRIMVLDTETTGSFDNGLVYDVGYTIAASNGEILHTRTHLIEEIFCDGARMMGAYFAKKFFSYYARALQDGEITLASWQAVVSAMQSDASNFEVTGLAAYNLDFDKRVMRNTHRLLSGSGHVLPPMRQLCLWRWLKATKLKTKTYRQWCRENGYLTKTNRAKTTAELAYRYVFGQHDYIEPHTALGDALMETELLARQFQQKQRIPWL